MRPPQINSDKFEPGYLVASILKLSKDTAQKASEVEEELDEINQTLRELAGRLDLQTGQVQPFLKLARPGPPLADDQTLKRKAQDGVASIALRILPYGRATLQIEGRTKILLSPSLAALVATLTANHEPSTDHLIAWRSDEDTIADLQRRTGRQYTQHAFNQLIYLLRCELKQHGENPWLVMRRPKLGSRFALWRGPSDVTGDSHK